MIKNKKWISAFLLMLLTIMFPAFGLNSFAADDPMIIVSMGDSYSTGEGLTPYYGQEKPLKDRIKDTDWLAHRSLLSWPALLEVPGYAGTLSDYRQTGGSNDACQWYFVASSGAVIREVYAAEQRVYAFKADKTGSGVVYRSNLGSLPVQTDVFNTINGDVDYVTITIGGNDADFGKAISTCAKHSTYLGSAPLDLKVEEQLQNTDGWKDALAQTYREIAKAAGSQAAILAVGYPKILDVNGKGSLYSPKEAACLNGAVSTYNSKNASVTEMLRKEGINIYFVSVEEAFDADGGHSAYSKDPWISGIIMGAQEQEINDTNIISGSSFHPTEEGSRAYAKCVGAKIKELENAHNIGTLSGTVRAAYEQSKAVSFADIKIYDMNNTLVYAGNTDLNGEFSTSVVAGEYRVVVSASGYDSGTSYATVTKDKKTSAEILLFPAGQSQEIGTVTGRARNNDTGSSVPGIKVTARKGRDNYTGSVVVSVTGDNKGNYSFRLPAGEYCLTFEKEGFVTKGKNIVVSGELTDNQTTWMIPGISCTVTGRARNNDTGTSVSGVRVSARKGWDNYVGAVAASATGDNKGNYSLILPAGEYCLTFEKEGFVTKSKNITVSGELTDNQTIWMIPGINCTVIGKARSNTTGSSVPGVKVSVRRGTDNYTGAVIATATGDNKGNYSVILPVGEYCLTFEKTGYVTKTRNIVVSEEYTDIQTTWMNPGINCTVTGKIRSNANGSSLPGVKVSARKGRDNYNGAVVAKATGDNKGNYSLTLPFGEYCLIFEKAGYVTKTRNIVVTEELTELQTMWMSPETGKAMTVDQAEELIEMLPEEFFEEWASEAEEEDVSGDSSEITENETVEEVVPEEAPELDEVPEQESEPEHDPEEAVESVLDPETQEP